MSPTDSAPPPTSPASDANGLFEQLFEESAFPIVVCDARGIVLRSNEAARRLVCGADDLAHRPWTALFPSDARPAADERLRECIASGAAVEFQVRLGGTEVEPIVYAVQLAPLASLGGVRHVAVWLRDISPRVRLATALAKTERLGVLGKLSGAVAHHYNNLIQCIAMSLEYGLNMNTVAAMRRALARTAEPVRRAAEMTRQLLAFARADHRDADESDLTETFLMFFDEQEPRLRSRGIRLVLDYEGLPVSRVLRQPLRVVLENIVENAMDAMPAGGTLTATLNRRDEHSACISIIDTGAGLAQADMEHIFEPFYTTKGELGGGQSQRAGMGLAVAHGLVQGMRGEILPANVPGRGARFDVILPLAAP